jgi:hypothetical protein
MFQQSTVRKFLLVAPLLLLGGSISALGQVQAAAVSGSGINFFSNFGGLRTHVIGYTYNALGIEGGIFVQRSPLFGVEVRGATYPFYARYSQSPVTAGFRTEVPGPRWNSITFSGYFGGGMSLAQSAGPHYTPTPAQWSPCWQVSQSLSISRGVWKWKPYEGTWTQTYTPERTLRGLSLTTGITYTFTRARRQVY